MTARDPMGALIDAMFDAVGAAYQVQGSLEEKIREQRRNDPELRAIRSRAALKGWGTRRAREAAERAAEEAEEKRRQDLYDREGPGPWCEAMDIHPVTGETTCILAPGHGGDCEDVYGHNWTREDNDE